MISRKVLFAVTDPAQVALTIARLWGQLGGNSRLCYRLLVERMAPDTAEALVLLRRRRLFLISSTGRTGTKWLSSLLNEIEGAWVVHEPVPEEQFYHVEAFRNPERAMPYLREFRFREMALRIRARDPAVYGEVNGALRRHTKALRDLIPEMPIIHLVRDGRAVVTSILNRSTLTPSDRIYADFQPRAEEIEPALWQSMDRFTRICWMWAHENIYLRGHVHHLARFEDITTRYDLFKEQILDPLNLDLEKAVWAARAAKPENVTLVTRYPGYRGWTDDQKDTFWRLCGKEMKTYGYGE